MFVFFKITDISSPKSLLAFMCSYILPLFTIFAGIFSDHRYKHPQVCVLHMHSLFCPVLIFLTILTVLFVCFQSTDISTTRYMLVSTHVLSWSFLTVFRSQTSAQVHARLYPYPILVFSDCIICVFQITDISTPKYLLASMLGLLPTQGLHAYIGSTLRSMEDVLTDEADRTTGYIVFSTQVSHQPHFLKKIFLEKMKWKYSLILNLQLSFKYSNTCFIPYLFS